MDPRILTLPALSATLLCALLSACGGGGGAGAGAVVVPPPVTPPVVTPPVDAARLELLAGDDGGSARVDGAGTLARFTNILGGNVDAAGNIYIAEDSPALRKVTAAGVVSTLTSTASGYVDGAKGTARLGRPLCPVAGGADGGVYFVEGLTLDTSESPTIEVPVRKLAADGGISTIARISINRSERLCLAGGGGKLYAYQSQRISVIAADGAVTTLAGAVNNGVFVPANGQGAAARFVSIQSVAADNGGNLYVNDNSDVIRKVTAAGLTSTLAGAYRSGVPGAAVAPVDGVGAAARFSQLSNLVFTGAGKLMAYDLYQSGPFTEERLRGITTDGVVSSVLVQRRGALAAGPGDALYQILGNQINIQRADGTTTPLAGKERTRVTGGDANGTGAAARFSDIFSAMTSDPAGNVYVADNVFPGLHFTPTGLRLRKVTPAGVVTTIPHSASVWKVAGMFADAAGNVYVATYDDSTMVTTDRGGLIYKIAADGATTVLAGARPATVSKDGTGAAASFIRPQLLGLDGDGNLYTADYADGNAVAYRKITPAGVVSTIAAPPAGLGDVKDDSGNKYSIDSQQGTVVRTTPAGAVSNVAGTPGENYTYGGGLPGHLQTPGLLVKTGPYSFAVTSGGAIMRLVVAK